MSTATGFDGGAAELQAEYAAAARKTEIAGYDYTDADHETFLEDKDAISGVDLEDVTCAWCGKQHTMTPETDVVHVAPAVDRQALCLEGTGTHKPLAVVLASVGSPACGECLAIADRLDGIELYDLARLAAGVAAGVTVTPTPTRLETEALAVRDLATREVVAVRLLVDPAAPLSAIKADLWQEIRAERPHLYAALCAGDVAAAYALEAARS